MAGEKPLHEGTERGIGERLHDEMEVIGHETEGQNFYREFGFCLGEQVRDTGHGMEGYYEGGEGCNGKSSLFLFPNVHQTAVEW